jgi:hypothetical protein
MKMSLSGEMRICRGKRRLKRICPTPKSKKIAAATTPKCEWERRLYQGSITICPPLQPLFSILHNRFGVLIEFASEPSQKQ